MGFADALEREAAWLQTTSDGLPDLTVLFKTIQPNWRRTPATKNTQLYVMHFPEESSRLNREVNQRAMLTHHLMLRIIWPVTSSTGRAEDDQLKLRQAIDAVIARVMGPIQDKTHGGRFLTVADAASNEERFLIHFPDVERAIAEGEYRAAISYYADDFETSN